MSRQDNPDTSSTTDPNREKASLEVEIGGNVHTERLTDIREPTSVMNNGTPPVNDSLPSSGQDSDGKTSDISPEYVGLSKNQRKRLLKREKMQEKKRQKKEERRAKAISAGRDLEAERKLQEERTALGIRRKRLDEMWQTVKRPLAEKSFQICIDCSFEHLMIEREISSLAQQLRYCYSYNKNAANPCLATATSLKDGNKTLTLLQKEAGFLEWANRLFTCTDASLEEYYNNQRPNIIYLTSDSETTLETLDDTKIYVIGGIVDRNRLKRVAMDRAEQLGVTTARLPLDAHLAQMESTPVLTCNHVFDILLKCRQHGNDWSKALQEVLPSRKDAKFKAVTGADEKNSNNGKADSKSESSTDKTAGK